MECVLKYTIYEIDQIKPIQHPQIPIAGRSNVGKSSFINCLAGQKNLARTSSKPGKTRSINFYFLKKLKGYLVDLPGYGYARASKKEREKWAKLVDLYFEKNISQITGVILLIDSRIPPQETDILLFNYLKEKGCEIVPVLTKCDKAKTSTRTRIENFWKEFSSPISSPVLFSARTSLGKGRICEIINNLLER